MARSLRLVFGAMVALVMVLAAAEAFPNFPNFGCGIVKMLDPEHQKYPYDRYSGYKPIDYEYPGYGYFGRPYYQAKQIYGDW